MSSRTINLAAVTCVALLVVAISLIIISGPLYGEAKNDNWVPDMIGTWAGGGVGYVFWDVTHPDPLPSPYEQPFYVEGVLDRDLVITHQTGRVFAGEYGSDEGDGGNRFKLTGVIMPDRTVSIQYFEPSGEKHFITGRLTRSGGTLQISGYLQFFDDFQHTHWPYEESDKKMASAYVQLIKVS